MTLLETVISLGILGILAATIAPMAFNLLEADRERATEKKAENIFRAIYGAPERGDFGYLGDMGRLPATLTELLAQGSQTAFHAADGATDHLGKVGTGWRGPYLKGLSQDGLLKDAWGNSYLYTDSGASAGQISSGGPDANTGTAGDNIVFPANAPGTTGTLLVSVLINRIPEPVGAVVRLYTSSNGEQALFARKTTSDTGFDGFIFQNVPPGLHALRVAHIGLNTQVTPNVCTTVTREVTVQVVPNQQVVKEIRILTAADVKVQDTDCLPIPDSL
jgi:type II secretory pathway pseudopilin PulG